MLYWSIVFLLISLVAALFGFGGIADSAAGMAKILFVVFLVLFAVSGILSLANESRGDGDGYR